MRYKVGDRVRFLNDVGGGKVTRIIDKRTIAVTNQDGFEIPVLETEVLMVDNKGDHTLIAALPEDEYTETGNRKKASAQSIAPVPEQISESPEVSINYSEKTGEIDPKGELLGLFAAFVPTNQSNVGDSDQALHLINDSPYRLFYVVSRWEKDTVIPLKAGFLYSDSKEEIATISKTDLNAELTLNFQILFFKNTSYKPHQPEYYDLAINPAKFYRKGSYIENDFFDESAMIISIADSKKEEVLKSLTSKAISESILSKDIKPIPEKKVENDDEIVEVDLHIHELVDSTSNLSPTEMLDIQMARFKVSLDTALNSKSKKIVFIHGVGNGKLKHEVLKELAKSYPKLRYQDASFREYGYGATMVFLR
jgi:hypothetical protein